MSPNNHYNKLVKLEWKWDCHCLKAWPVISVQWWYSDVLIFGRLAHNTHSDCRSLASDWVPLSSLNWEQTRANRWDNQTPVSHQIKANSGKTLAFIAVNNTTIFSSDCNSCAQVLAILITYFSPFLSSVFLHSIL